MATYKTFSHIGKAYVVDGNTLKVARTFIRIEGIAAPDLGQIVKDTNGSVVDQGKRAKSELINEIGGKEVRIVVKGYGEFGRVIGSVTCDSKDVGEWLVSNGYAAAYGDQYKSSEREARKEKRGIWGCVKSTAPRSGR